jgi:hypothetical protein
MYGRAEHAAVVVIGMIAAQFAAPGAAYDARQAPSLAFEKFPA